MGEAEETKTPSERLGVVVQGHDSRTGEDEEGESQIPGLRFSLRN